MVGQHPEGASSHFGVVSLEERGIDVHFPAFDLLHHRIEANPFFTRPLVILLGEQHRGEGGNEQGNGQGK